MILGKGKLGLLFIKRITSKKLVNKNTLVVHGGTHIHWSINSKICIQPHTLKLACLSLLL